MAGGNEEVKCKSHSPNQIPDSEQEILKQRCLKTKVQVLIHRLDLKISCNPKCFAESEAGMSSQKTFYGGPTFPAPSDLPMSTKYCVDDQDMVYVLEIPSKDPCDNLLITDVRGNASKDFDNAFHEIKREDSFEEMEQHECNKLNAQADSVKSIIRADESGSSPVLHDDFACGLPDSSQRPATTASTLEECVYLPLPNLHVNPLPDPLPEAEQCTAPFKDCEDIEKPSSGNLKLGGSRNGVTEGNVKIPLEGDPDISRAKEEIVVIAISSDCSLSDDEFSSTSSRMHELNDGPPNLSYEKEIPSQSDGSDVDPPNLCKSDFGFVLYSDDCWKNRDSKTKGLEMENKDVSPDDADATKPVASEWLRPTFPPKEINSHHDLSRDIDFPHGSEKKSRRKSASCKRSKTGNTSPVFPEEKVKKRRYKKITVPEVPKCKSKDSYMLLNKVNEIGTAEGASLKVVFLKGKQKKDDGEKDPTSQDLKYPRSLHRNSEVCREREKNGSDATLKEDGVSTLNGGTAPPSAENLDLGCSEFGKTKYASKPKGICREKPRRGRRRKRSAKNLNRCKEENSQRLLKDFPRFNWLQDKILQSLSPEKECLPLRSIDDDEYTKSNSSIEFSTPSSTLHSILKHGNPIYDDGSSAAHPKRVKFDESNLTCIESESNTFGIASICEERSKELVNTNKRRAIRIKLPFPPLTAEDDAYRSPVIKSLKVSIPVEKIWHRGKISKSNAEMLSDKQWEMPIEDKPLMDDAHVKEWKDGEMKEMLSNRTGENGSTDSTEEKSVKDGVLCNQLKDSVKEKLLKGSVEKESVKANFGDVHLNACVKWSAIGRNLNEEASSLSQNGNSLEPPSRVSSENVVSSAASNFLRKPNYSFHKYSVKMFLDDNFRHHADSTISRKLWLTMLPNASCSFAWQKNSRSFDQKDFLLTLVSGNSAERFSTGNDEFQSSDKGTSLKQTGCTAADYNPYFRQRSWSEPSMVWRRTKRISYLGLNSSSYRMKASDTYQEKMNAGVLGDVKFSRFICVPESLHKACADHVVCESFVRDIYPGFEYFRISPINLSKMLSSDEHPKVTEVDYKSLDSDLVAKTKDIPNGDSKIKVQEAEDSDVEFIEEKKFAFPRASGKMKFMEESSSEKRQDGKKYLNVQTKMRDEINGLDATAKDDLSDSLYEKCMKKVVEYENKRYGNGVTNEILSRKIELNDSQVQQLRLPKFGKDICLDTEEKENIVGKSFGVSLPRQNPRDSLDFTTCWQSSSSEDEEDLSVFNFNNSVFSTNKNIESSDFVKDNCVPQLGKVAQVWPESGNSDFSENKGNLEPAVESGVNEENDSGNLLPQIGTDNTLPRIGTDITLPQIGTDNMSQIGIDKSLLDAGKSQGGEEQDYVQETVHQLNSDYYGFSDLVIALSPSRDEDEQASCRNIEISNGNVRGSIPLKGEIRKAKPENFAVLPEAERKVANTKFEIDQHATASANISRNTCAKLKGNEILGKQEQCKSQHESVPVTSIVPSSKSDNRQTCFIFNLPKQTSKPNCDENKRTQSVIRITKSDGSFRQLEYRTVDVLENAPSSSEHKSGLLCFKIPNKVGKSQAFGNNELNLGTGSSSDTQVVKRSLVFMNMPGNQVSSVPSTKRKALRLSPTSNANVIQLSGLSNLNIMPCTYGKTHISNATNEQETPVMNIDNNNSQIISPLKLHQNVHNRSTLSGANVFIGMTKNKNEKNMCQIPNITCRKNVRAANKSTCLRQNASSGSSTTTKESYEIFRLEKNASNVSSGTKLKLLRQVRQNVDRQSTIVPFKTIKERSLGVSIKPSGMCTPHTSSSIKAKPGVPVQPHSYIGRTTHSKVKDSSVCELLQQDNYDQSSNENFSVCQHLNKISRNTYPKVQTTSAIKPVEFTSKIVSNRRKVVVSPAKVSRKSNTTNLSTLPSNDIQGIDNEVLRQDDVSELRNILQMPRINSLPSITTKDLLLSERNLISIELEKQEKELQKLQSLQDKISLSCPTYPVNIPELGSKNELNVYMPLDEEISNFIEQNISKRYCNQNLDNAKVNDNFPLIKLPQVLQEGIRMPSIPSKPMSFQAPENDLHFSERPLPELENSSPPMRMKLNHQVQKLQNLYNSQMTHFSESEKFSQTSPVSNKNINKFPANQSAKFRPLKSGNAAGNFQAINPTPSTVERQLNPTKKPPNRKIPALSKVPNARTSLQGPQKAVNSSYLPASKDSGSKNFKNPKETLRETENPRKKSKVAANFLTHSTSRSVSPNTFLAAEDLIASNINEPRSNFYGFPSTFKYPNTMSSHLKQGNVGLNEFRKSQDYSNFAVCKGVQLNNSTSFQDSEILSHSKPSMVYGSNINRPGTNQNPILLNNKSDKISVNEIPPSNFQSSQVNQLDNNALKRNPSLLRFQPHVVCGSDTDSTSSNAKEHHVSSVISEPYRTSVTGQLRSTDVAISEVPFRLHSAESDTIIANTSYDSAQHFPSPEVGRYHINFTNPSSQLLLPPPKFLQSGVNTDYPNPISLTHFSLPKFTKSDDVQISNAYPCALPYRESKNVGMPDMNVSPNLSSMPPMQSPMSRGSDANLFRTAPNLQSSNAEEFYVADHDVGTSPSTPFYFQQHNLRPPAVTESNANVANGNPISMNSSSRLHLGSPGFRRSNINMASEKPMPFVYFQPPYNDNVSHDNSNASSQINALGLRGVSGDSNLFTNFYSDSSMRNTVPLELPHIYMNIGPFSSDKNCDDHPGKSSCYAFPGQNQSVNELYGKQIQDLHNVPNLVNFQRPRKIHASVIPSPSNCQSSMECSDQIPRAEARPNSNLIANALERQPGQSMPVTAVPCMPPSGRSKTIQIEPCKGQEVVRNNEGDGRHVNAMQHVNESPSTRSGLPSYDSYMQQKFRSSSTHSEYLRSDHRRDLQLPKLAVSPGSRRGDDLRRPNTNSSQVQEAITVDSEEQSSEARTNIFPKSNHQENDYSEIMHYCSSCTMPAKYMCKACKRDWYCSEACQICNWNKHSPVCTMHEDCNK